MPLTPPEQDVQTRLRARLTAALERERGTNGARKRDDGDSIMEAMNVLCGRLAEQLRRWLGAAGWHALLTRSVATATAPPPAGPGAMVVGSGDVLHWTDDESPALVREACVGVLLAMALTLGRFIGNDMAMQVMERAFASINTQGSDHG